MVVDESNNNMSGVPYTVIVFENTALLGSLFLTIISLLLPSPLLSSPTGSPTYSSTLPSLCKPLVSVSVRGYWPRFTPVLLYNTRVTKCTSVPLRVISSKLSLGVVGHIPKLPAFTANDPEPVRELLEGDMSEDER